MTLDTRLQKITSAGRSAKIGERNYCPDSFAGCWHRKRGCTDIGGTFHQLWSVAAVNKSLAIISDARLSGRTDQAIVTERLLSISGEDSLTIDIRTGR